MKPKKVIRLLQREARKLPLETYYAIEKYYTPKQEILGEENGVSVKGDWKKGEVVEHPRNLDREIKKIYKKWGWEAALAWFYVKKNKETNALKAKKNEEIVNL
jgi:hypothetical protein